MFPIFMSGTRQKARTKMTDKEKAIVMAHTGKCMLTGDKFQIFHKYVEDIMGRPIMTHEIGLLADTIKEKSRADFIALCADKEDWLDVPSDEMTLEQARQAVKDLRKKLVEYLEQEPKKGHWIFKSSYLRWDMYKCSECGEIHASFEIGECGANYCPKCGAKMESEVNNG